MEILELRNVISEMKNSLNRLRSMLDSRENGYVNSVIDRNLISQIESQKGKKKGNGKPKEDYWALVSYGKINIYVLKYISN